MKATAAQTQVGRLRYANGDYAPAFKEKDQVKDPYRQDARDLIEQMKSAGLVILPKRGAISSGNNSLKIGSPDVVGDKFRSYLIKMGFSSSDAQEIADKLVDFVSEELPELSALSAVAELREQYTSRQTRGGYKQILSAPRKYLGRRSGIEPVDFLLKNYRPMIERSEIGPGQLCDIDKTLYNTVVEDLKKEPQPDAILALSQELGRPIGTSIKSLFESLKPREKAGTPMMRRRAAAAALLGTGEDEASNFFANLRVDRTSPSRAPRRSKAERS